MSYFSKNGQKKLMMSTGYLLIFLYSRLVNGKSLCYSVYEAVGAGRKGIGGKTHYMIGGNGMQKVYDFLKSAGTYYLATVEGDQPRVRPFGTVHIFEGKLYIQTGRVKPVSKQLAENPKAEICAFKNGAWLRLACELVEDDRVEARKSMLDAYPNLRAMYNENDGNTQVLYVRNAVATLASFGKPAETVEF